MRAEADIKAVYRSIIDAISRGDVDGLDDLVTEDVIDHNPNPGQAPGVDGFREWIVSAHGAFPDLEGTIEDVIAEGDRVAGRVTWRGTHDGEFAGVPPTGRSIAMVAFHLVRFEDGRAAEWWGTADALGALHEIGATVTAPAT